MQKGQQNKNGGTKIGGDSASAKRSAEQKLVGTVGHWVMGTPSASAKRSVEQKLRNKNCGTKIGKCKCKTWSVEQKLRNKNQWNKNCGTKIGGDSWPLGDGDPKCKCKKVSGTKIAEQKLRNMQLLKGQQVQKSAEQKLRNKNWWGLSAIG